MTKDVYRCHHLWTDNSNYGRHRAIIHESCKQFPLGTQIEKFVEPIESTASTASGLSDDFDGWEIVMMRDDKLKASFYISNLLRKLGAYQVHRMIEHQFHCGGKEMVTLAKNVADHLRAVSIATSKTQNRKWNIDLDHNDFYVRLLNGEKDRETMKSSEFQTGAFGNNSWAQAIKSPKFIQFLGDLTAADVAFIVSCFVDSRKSQTNRTS